MPLANFLNMQRLCALANLALITLGVYFAVSTFYGLLETQMQPDHDLAPAAQGISIGESAAVRPVNYYNPILDRDLFRIRKTAQAAAPSPAVDLENLERTQLNLKLWGTVSGDPQKAYAVIEDMQKREQNLYRIGDLVQNATIKVIMREKVVLNFEGKDEVLDMADIQQAASSPMMASRGRPHVMPPPGEPLMPSEGEQRITIQRNMLEESFADVNRLMTEIAISPNMEEGEPAGLALSRIAPNSIFRRMGLRNGDVLLGVNGQQILSAEDAMRMYEGLRSSDEIQLQLKRRGQERTIQYSIR
jgi:general secretion pathway protein C